ncbi:MAG: hypothetical protein AUI91_05700 [Acidobacteria bacterium 13_1_40CM_3_56_11]|nr:MAG: hypothetical protein AUI91_05700 [Acidobacteria bacterium 13_1_40CM_3_56_11]
MILWRPVGFHEMAKVFEAGMKGFPPRLPEQSIFYPVLVQEYADQTAATWNTKEEPFVGYVIEMEILDEYGARFTPQTVGSAIHRELWVPSEELAEFNNQLTKPVSVRRAYFGPKYRGHVPDKFGLRGADAYKQIAMMVGTMDYSMFDFAMEVSANMLTFFLNFPFWKAAGAGRLDVEAVQLDTCLEHIRKAWSRSPRPAALAEDATCTA